MRTVAFHTLGCKLNFSETSAISRQFYDAGFSKSSFSQAADVYVVNTCSVTENANKKCRKIIKQALKHNPHAYVIVVGCYAQLKPKEISEIPGVDLVLGAGDKFRIFELVDEFSKEENPCVYNSQITEVDSFVDAYSHGDRTRSFLKIQDGCDYKCSFCTIPLARGRSRSDTIENILANARKLAAQGVQEIVLTGVNIGDYGKGLESKDSFLDVVKALDEIEEVSRFRISSIEPNLLSNEIIQFVAQSKRFMPHFHIPLQSGNNELLGKMRRRYRRELYVDRVSEIKRLMPHACIGVDVIVGFPGETDDHFEDSYIFLNELDISYLHVFTYSERENTLAAGMEGVVPVSVRHERSKRLRMLSDKKKRFFYEQYVGEERPILFEGAEDKGAMFGFTDNYIKVKTDFDPEKINQIQIFGMEEVNAEGLMEIRKPVVPA
ncbi:MAG: tRNA (N(6)-L-threonylcarbamoyladenosine(37)-C(2))-methylthiotransferase MtaB [Bacteroidia bacterium]|nr:tRNA (N(6)-L-threonylcarbamoyladenosine(37)-C(2))-methylthiotransferase MtaB [Bacteroidia bacterium]